MSFEIKEILVEDINEINQIQKLAFKDSFERYKFCPAYEVTDDQVITFLEKAIGYKIIFDNVIVGSVFVCKISDSHYELNTITVSPEFQNRGIGFQAIKEIEKNHPNVLVWTLSTPDSDTRNRYFYEKLGYYQVGSEYINEYLTLTEYKKNI